MIAEVDRLLEPVVDRYRRAPRTEPCICGGFIVAGPSEVAIVAAVRRHQRTPKHQRWLVVHEAEVWS